LGLKLYEDGRHEEIYNGPVRLIYDHYSHRKWIGERQLSFPIRELRRLSAGVDSRDRIPLRVPT